MFCLQLVDPFKTTEATVPFSLLAAAGDLGNWDLCLHAPVSWPSKWEQWQPRLVGVVGRMKGNNPGNALVPGLAEPESNQGWLLFYYWYCPWKVKLPHLQEETWGHEKGKTQVDFLFPVNRKLHHTAVGVLPLNGFLFVGKWDRCTLWFSAPFFKKTKGIGVHHTRGSLSVTLSEAGVEGMVPPLSPPCFTEAATNTTAVRSKQVTAFTRGGHGHTMWQRDSLWELSEVSLCQFWKPV